MFNACRAMLLAVVVAAAMALTASAAYGQVVELTDEVSSEHCPSVSLSGDHGVEDGCPIHYASVGEVTLTSHVFGIEVAVSECTNEFTARLDEGAEGYVTEQVLSGESCMVEACTEEGSDTDPWPVVIDEPSGGSPARATVDICLTNTESEATLACETQLPFEETWIHASKLIASDTTCDGGAFDAELTGEWHTEEGDEGDAIVEVSPTQEPNEEPNNLRNVTAELDFQGAAAETTTLQAQFRNDTGVEITTSTAYLEGRGRAAYSVTGKSCAPVMLPAAGTAQQRTCTIDVKKVGATPNGVAGLEVSFTTGAGTRYSCTLLVHS